MFLLSLSVVVVVIAVVVPILVVIVFLLLGHVVVDQVLISINYETYTS